MKKKLEKSTKAINSSWDESEVASYNRFLEHGTVEQLAYTAVQEAYNARIQKEALQKKEESIVSAIKKMSIGICRLQNLLGFNINKLAAEAESEELESILGDADRRWKRGKV